MKWFLLFSWFLLVATVCKTQPSDFIVVKKRNNRTLKTYFTGIFISGQTYSGFSLNGIIKDIRNDSVFVEQQRVQQVATQFGVPKLDTLIFTIGIHYTEIKSVFYSGRPGIGGAPRVRGFSQVSLPKLMMIGGAGYVILELVNSAYRKESLRDQDKLKGIGIAGGVAVVGFLWQQLKNQSGKAGVGYKIVYVKMGER